MFRVAVANLLDVSSDSIVILSVTSDESSNGLRRRGILQTGSLVVEFMIVTSTLEEARADLVGLYYLMDPKLVEMGLITSLDVGKTAYDGYIRNGLVTQLMRLEPGAVIEEAHMRNRQLVAAWAMEKGAEDKVIENHFTSKNLFYS